MRLVMATLIVAALLVPAVASAEDNQMANINQFRLSKAVRDAGLKEGVRLAAHARTTSRQQQSSQPHWIKRHPVLFGTLIGAAVGAVGAERNRCSNSGGDDECIYAFAFIPIGAGVGALAGWVASLAD